MLLHIKKICPEWLRRYARLSREKWYRALDTFTPYLTSRRYQGFRLYYTRGAGLIDRIRLGNTNSTYEPELVRKMTEVASTIPKPVCIDIGTNIGLISLSILQANPNISIFGFEPSPIAYKSFCTTIFANQIENKIKLFNYAVDEHIGQSMFSAHNDRDSSGDGLIDTHRAQSDASLIKVTTTTLDTWWVEIGKPHIDIIKIDIEGAELRALRGATLLLQTTRPVIFLEISLENLKVYPYKAIDIFNFFKKYKYDLKTLQGVLCTETDFAHIVEKTDSFMAVPGK